MGKTGDGSKVRCCKKQYCIGTWNVRSMNQGNWLVFFYNQIDYILCRQRWRSSIQQKQHPVVDVTGDRSKIWCSKEQYCIGTWNIRSMNQGKLEVVKQEMARVNVDILGISELRWTGMGEFNSDDHYIYYCGQKSLRRNGSSHHGQQESLKCSTWMQS